MYKNITLRIKNKVGISYNCERLIFKYTHLNYADLMSQLCKYDKIEKCDRLTHSQTK